MVAIAGHKSKGKTEQKVRKGGGINQTGIWEKSVLEGTVSGVKDQIQECACCVQ